MKVVSVEQRVFRDFAHCECGGVLEPTGVAYATSPPSYPHQCTKCQKQQTLRHVYPVVRYETLDG